MVFFRSRAIATAAAVLVVLGLCFVPSKGMEPTEQTTINIQESAESLAFRNKVKEGEYRKIGGVLGKLVEGTDTTTEGFDAKSELLTTPEGEVLVEVAFKLGLESNPSSDFEAIGFRSTACIHNVCSGYAIVDTLVELSSHPTVQVIKPVYKPIVGSNSRNLRNRSLTGSVKSEGDVAMQTNVIRAQYGLTGAGQAVGILSDSFSCSFCTCNGVSVVDDFVTGDIPPVVVLEDYNQQGCIDEGRAMAQIVYDVAPGATLLFHTAFKGAIDFAQGIIDLADAGATVIVDDVTYFSQPFFQDDVVTQAADTVAARGIPFFSSAGNSARNAWHTDHGFVDSGLVLGTGKLHNFSPHHPHALDTIQQIELEPFSPYVFVLQWDQPSASVPGSTSCQSDVDVYLFDETGTSILARSVDDNLGGDAVEDLFFTTGPATTYGISIVLFNGPAPGYMKWVLYRSDLVDVEYKVLSSTLVNHHNAAGGAGVGAAYWSNTPPFGVSPPEQQPFTSAGGHPILLDTAGNRLDHPDVREQPRFTGPDGGITTFFFGPTNRFNGTSAAAPHVAALAALMKERASPDGITPTEIYSILQHTAIDMDDIATHKFDKGFDFGTGYGLVDAVAALEITPTSMPSTSPSAMPTDQPSDSPTKMPSSSPSESVMPSVNPSSEPSSTPTMAPTKYRLQIPTPYPTFDRGPHPSPTEEEDTDDCFSISSTALGWLNFWVGG